VSGKAARLRFGKAAAPKNAPLAVKRAIWVWDWGRKESPTEFQFRSHERETGCSKNSLLRRTLSDVFDQAKKNDVPYADLAEQKIKTAMGASLETATRGGKRRGGRRR